MGIIHHHFYSHSTILGFLLPISLSFRFRAARGFFEGKLKKDI